MENKVIETKQKFCWHFVDVYWDMLIQISAIREDKVFCEKLYDLKNYLCKKLALKSEDDIIDTYVVVLQEDK